MDRDAEFTEDKYAYPPTRKLKHSEKKKRCLNCGEEWEPETPGYEGAEGSWVVYTPCFEPERSHELRMEGCIACDNEFEKAVNEPV